MRRQVKKALSLAIVICMAVSVFSVGTLAASEADYTTCTGIAVEVHFHTDEYESCSFSSADGAEVSAKFVSMSGSTLEGAGIDFGSVDICYNLTITETGEHEITCTGEKSEKTSTFTISVNPHEIEYHAAIEPTCSKEGNTEYYQCSVCGTYFTDADGENTTTWESIEIPCLPHTLGEIDWTWSDDYKEASITSKCEVCGETVTLDATVTSSTTATCTEPGTTTYKASVSYGGEEYTDEVTTETDALGHSWGVGVVTKEPTATEEGTIEYTCEVCGETMEEPIPTLTDIEASEEPVNTAVGTDANNKQIDVSVETVNPDDNDVAKEIMNVGNLTEVISGLEDALNSAGLSADDVSVNRVVNISVNEDAEFPVTIEFETGLTSEYYKSVLLAHYDEETGAWTYVDATWDGAGKLTFEAEDESDLGIFAILTIPNDDSKDNNNNNNNNNNSGVTYSGNNGTGSNTSSGITSPQTSEPNAFGLWMIVAVFGVAGCVFFVRYRSSKSKEG